MKLDDSIFWLGSEASLRHVIDAQVEIQGRVFDGEDYDDDQSRLLSVTEGVGTVKVHGSLTSTDSPWNALFGMTSYNEIRNGIIEAIENEDVTRIILDVDTPGGDAKGVSDLSDFITVARQHKSIDSFISGSAFSAGYWIASATDKLYGPKMSESGSIGVIAVLMNYSKAMKDAGYEVTVFRGGKYKALGNPYEKLTDTAKKIYQKKIDAMEGFFLDAVSENRSIPRNKVKSQVGEGLTFFAEESVQNGLMDEVITFDQFFNRLIKQSQTSSAGGRTILSEETDMKKKVLTAEAVAAIASGAASDAVEELLEEAPTSAEEATGEEATEQATETPEQAEETETEVEASETDKEATAEEEAAPEQASETELVAYLKAEVATLRTDNAALSVDLEKFKAAATTAEANETALKELANEYISGMAVGLGMSAMDLSAMDTTNVLLQYNAVRTPFTARFKVGSKAEVTDGEPESSGDGNGMTFMEQASVKANKI